MLFLGVLQNKAMASLSCIRLGVPSPVMACNIECGSTASSLSRDVKQGAGLRVEPCVGCTQSTLSTLASSGSWNLLGLGRAAGLNDLNCRSPSREKNEDKSRRRLEIVQQAAPSTSTFSERNPKFCATLFRSSGSRSAFAIVQAALTPEQLEDGSRLTSVKDYNSALLRCVRYAHLCRFYIVDDNVLKVRLFVNEMKIRIWMLAILSL